MLLLEGGDVDMVDLPSSAMMWHDGGGVRGGRGERGGGRKDKNGEKENQLNRMKSLTFVR